MTLSDYYSENRVAVESSEGYKSDELKVAPIKRERKRPSKKLQSKRVSYICLDKTKRVKNETMGGMTHI